jgi:ATP/ADP translocase
MQVLLTPVIVRRSSVFVGLALTPVVLSGGTLLNLFGATLFRATLLKLLDSGFAHSVQRSCTEMLYTPLPPNLTGEIKLLSEGVAGRAGLVMSGLVLWVLAPTLSSHRTLSLIAGLIVCWFVALLVLKNVYRSAVSPAKPAALDVTRRRAA